MRIVWDEPKRLLNMAQHEGLDFADLTPEFFATAVILPAKKGRLQAFGTWDEGPPIAVVFLPLGSQGLSVISMRRARTDERRLL